MKKSKEAVEQGGRQEGSSKQQAAWGGVSRRSVGHIHAGVGSYTRPGSPQEMVVPGATPAWPHRR
jgi:hypothetical protein